MKKNGFCEFEESETGDSVSKCKWLFFHQKISVDENIRKVMNGTIAEVGASWLVLEDVQMI